MGATILAPLRIVSRKLFVSLLTRRQSRCVNRVFRPRRPRARCGRRGRRACSSCRPAWRALILVTVPRASASSPCGGRRRRRRRPAAPAAFRFFCFFFFSTFFYWCSRFLSRVGVRVQASCCCIKAGHWLHCYRAGFADPEKWLVREFDDLCDRAQRSQVPTFASRRTIDAQTLLRSHSLCHKAWHLTLACCAITGPIACARRYWHRYRCARHPRHVSRASRGVWCQAPGTASWRRAAFDCCIRRVDEGVERSSRLEEVLAS